MNSTFEPAGLQNLGSVHIDGENVEFWWAVGTGFISAQFTERCPRGIANLDRIGDDEPVVVPLSHAAWLACGEREQHLTRAGQDLFNTWTREHRNQLNAASGGRRARELNATEPPDPLWLNGAVQPAERQQ